MTREEFIDRMSQLVDEYEKDHPDNNNVTVEIKFFVNSTFVWNGEKFEELQIPPSSNL